MKPNKLLLIHTGLAVILAYSLFIASPVFADSNDTVIRGNVYNESNGGQGINGLTINISCTNKKGQISTTTATTSGHYQGHDAGLYQITFEKKQCGPGDFVKVTTIFNGQPQEDDRNVSTDKDYNGKDYEATADFYFGSESVPEFSLMTSIFAVLSSASSFIILRKKSII